MSGASIVWFRHDTRLSDNPALAAAVGTGAPVIPVFVLDDAAPGLRLVGGAARWWTHHGLAALDADLRRRGSRLILRRGRTGEVFDRLVAETGAGAVFWNRRYDTAGRDIDAGIETALTARGVRTGSFGASLLHEPWTVRTQLGGPFRVFTPFWQACRTAATPSAPLPAPDRLEAPAVWPSSDPLASWRLLPTTPDWAGGLRETWTPGEAGAAAALATFLDDRLATYRDRRDRADLAATSALSPWLAAGDIGPRQVLNAVIDAARRDPEVTDQSVEKFAAELGWREFSWHLLFHFPTLPEVNFRAEFDAFPWRDDAPALRAWQRGLTGYPLVDAGMRQLWTTGWMHNRVRMVAASFLAKHLMIHWREGEAWFRDTLVDADPASNAAGWQWVAGSGADAAPFFRIFNPVLQGERFDPAGDYVRRYVPELARLPADWIHQPWKAPPRVLAEAGVRLGASYPLPIVDHGEARSRALAAFSSLRRVAA